MKFPITVARFEELKDLQGPLHLAIGVFDGVHLGHKSVIESAYFSAKRSGGICGVLTFDPHPSRLFRPDQPTQLIMPIETKCRMLHDVGVHVVIRKHFDAEFAAIPADGFLAELKQALPQLKSIYVGENFRFGKRRAGDVSTLIESGRQLGLGVFSAERIKHNGEPISSTRIRAELEAGAIESANDLLGYNYLVEGEIQPGAKLGSQIGFPTLNLAWSPECQPKFGVYFVRYRSSGSKAWLPAVANYGIRPTVENAQSTPLLEVHALTETTLTAGDAIKVECLQFIRAESKFVSLDALKAQITQDVETAKLLANSVQ